MKNVFIQLPKKKNNLTVVISKSLDGFWLMMYEEDKDECYVRISEDRAIALSEATNIPITQE